MIGTEDNHVMGLVVTMPLKVAETIIDSAIETRREEGMLPLTVAVLDAGGILVSLKREDGCGIMRGDIAIGKAWGALGMGVSSRTIGNRLSDRPSFQAALAAVSDGRFVPVPGGDLAAFEGILPYLETMAATVVWIGPSGHGQIAKIANQIVVAVNREAVAEALGFAGRAGADARLVRRALLGGLAQSRVLDLEGEAMVYSAFHPRYRTAHLRKDLASVMAAAAELGLTLPCTETVNALYGLPAGQPAGRKGNGKTPEKAPGR